MLRRLFSFTTGSLIAAFNVCMLLAQDTATISGTVSDSSGALIQGVDVIVTQTNTGGSRTAATNATGSFILSNLPLGPYRLQAMKTGFEVYVQTGIVLQVGSSLSIPVTLKVGNVDERIQVEASTSEVETRSLGVGSVVETQRILDLPLNGRQPTDLITLSGLAVQTGSSPTYTMATGVNISVAGGTSYSVQYNLDGASHLDTYVGTNMPLPFPEALQEFKLATSAQDATQGGGHSGATVDAVTKSGSNSFHGDVFEFFRNYDLNGRDFFSPGADGLKRNQFGGVIGGPIKKDKLFFFLGYEGTMIRQFTQSTIQYVPTAAELTGNFGPYIAAGCPGAAGVAASPIVHGGHIVIPLSPAALKISSFLPQSNNVCGQVFSGIPLHQNESQAPVRLDYNISPKNMLFARYIVTKIDIAQPYSISKSVLSTDGQGANDESNSLALGDTYLFSTSVVNSFRIFGNRVGATTPGAQTFGPQQVGINNFYDYYGNFIPIFLVSNGFSTNFISNFAIGSDTTTNFGLNDDLSVIRGSHQLSFGVNTMRALLNAHSYAWSEGFFLFAGIFGSPMVDFLTGNAAQFHQANPNPENLTQNVVGLYAADTWKVSRKVTLNYGLRWNPFIPMQFKQSDNYTFSLSHFYQNVRSMRIPTAPPGFLYPGDPGFNGRAGMDNAWNHFEPRVGLAWDPSGDGKTAIRAGAGIAYDFLRQDINENTSSVLPFRASVIESFPVSLDNPYANYPGGNPFPYNYNPKNPVFPNLSYQSFLPIPADIQTPVQYSWNFGIQRQVTKNVFVSATYVGSEIAHLWTGVDLNPPQLLPGVPNFLQAFTPVQIAMCASLQANCTSNENQRRLLELTNPSAGNAYGSLTSLDSSGTQHYDGLLVNARWRVGDNVNLGANWTWSHCIGLPVTTISNFAATYLNTPYQNNGPVDRHLDMGSCESGSLDIRQIVNVTLVLNTPRFENNWARRLGTGWTLSTIYTVRTGVPFDAQLGTDNALNGFDPAGNNYVPQRPNQVLQNVYASNKGDSCSPAPCVSYLNPAAFATPPAGTYGDLGIGALRGPGFWEWDQTVSRAFPVTEGTHLEFRAEAFNVTNSVRLGTPVATLGGTFGNIISDQSTTGSTGAGEGGRVVQFAMKYVF
jgi:Carboxypeptidase regulatory-like domain